MSFDYNAPISIHALRVEGDHLRYASTAEAPDFYPRPPGGGRRLRLVQLPKNFGFLSTPSGWRATVKTPFTKSITP